MKMIKNTFLFLPGISELKEKNIWKNGINNWNDFLSANKIKGISTPKKEGYNYLIKEAKENLFADNINYFYTLLSLKHQWRLYDDLKENICFLDIETSDNNRDITIIGLFDGVETKMLVNGINLYRENFINAINNFSMIVTFNGTSFDIPKIEKYFSTKINIPHIDLRHVLSKLGHKGGLKAIEKDLGIKRRKEVSLFNGHNAIDAWKMWKSTGDRSYLELLIMYNEEDVINLKQLAEYAVPKLWEKTSKNTMRTI